MQENKFESKSIGGSARVDDRGSGGVLQLDTVTPRIRRDLHPAPVQPLSTQTQPFVGCRPAERQYRRPTDLECIAGALTAGEWESASMAAAVRRPRRRSISRTALTEWRDLGTESATALIEV
ncbi:hypothetical protein [Rhodococcus rhodochrous]|uniref:hypothetical protein n=1 Tax=Rhodococcus rhodochrous TaxID=1829 RepID=UPI001780A0F0|nr:hypothetical protein [Rhodococcus rhodochrous]KLL96188.1 hypothetical protein NJ76_18050 [Rhodococcus sp. IITR03]